MQTKTILSITVIKYQENICTISSMGERHLQYGSWVITRCSIIIIIKWSLVQQHLIHIIN